MKKLIIILLVIALYPLSVPAQTRSDTSASARPQKERTGQKVVDENGDGMDDGVAGKGKGLRRGNDRFVDRDGDGICDDRTRGLGFRHGAGEGEGHMGKNSNGKGKRPGGRP
jgi:hypothetical protein